MVYAAPPSATSSTTTVVETPLAGDAPPRHTQRRHSRSGQFDTWSPATATTTTFSHTPPALPRRKSAKKAFFVSDESPSPEPEDERCPASPPLHINTADSVPSARAPPPQSIPFPRSSSGPISPTGDVLSPRPNFSRSPSSSIILSNGKPLKSSLKSAQNSYHDIPAEFRAAHLRAKSEPSTPSVKSVHFREEDDLEEVRVYNRTGRPANLLLKAGEETETETEAEGFPFPATSPYSPVMSPPVVAPASASPATLAFEIDPSAAKSSVVPRANPDVYANIHLESLSLSKPRPAAIHGSVLVRNVSFEKQVAIRFTFDDWQTTSEVFGKHVVSLPGLPPPFPRPSTVGDAIGSASASGGARAWDRFSFQIRVEDYASRLQERALVLVCRYTAPGAGEWWDNNAGGNYRVGFRRATHLAPTATPSSGPMAAPSTLRLTPHSSTAPDPSPLSSAGVSAYAAAPAGPPSPGLLTPAQVYAASINSNANARRNGSPAGSPRVSPTGSPSGSPNNSDNETRKILPRRTKPNMGLGLGLGLGLNVNGGGGATPRPPAMARSNSSPPVCSPSGGTPLPFFATASALGGAPPGRQQVVRPPATNATVSAATGPSRLGRLSLSNYARPAPPILSPHEPRAVAAAGRARSGSLQAIVGGQPATVFPPEGPSKAPEVHVTAASPPVSEKPAEQQPAKEAVAPIEIPQKEPQSPVEAQMVAGSPTSSSTHDSPVMVPSTSSSNASSPLATPSQLSLEDLPSFEAWTGRSPKDGTGSDSDHSTVSRASSTSTVHQIASPSPHRSKPLRSHDFVLNLPSPTSRGAINSPFSPVSTPRFALGASPDREAGGASSPQAARRDHDYEALVRQWCFAGSPMPGGTPIASPPLPTAQELSTLPLGAGASVRVQIALPRGSPPEQQPRTSPAGTPSFEPNAWLPGLSDGYGMGRGMAPERRTWEAGRA